MEELKLSNSILYKKSVTLRLLNSCDSQLRKWTTINNENTFDIKNQGFDKNE